MNTLTAYDNYFSILQMRRWIEKGYHIESVDGRKHSALSEAASQGHFDIVSYLLELGADPNSLSDTGRSPLWRAGLSERKILISMFIYLVFIYRILSYLAFAGHVSVCQCLLEAGSDPVYHDTTSMESAIDVAKSEDLRKILVR